MEDRAAGITNGRIAGSAKHSARNAVRDNQAAPLVSIITPTYNRARYLRETIESVLAQDYSHMEYIVLDDGSADETQALLSEYEGRIIAVRHPNMGETRTVNRGIELARGEIVAVVNSDDPLLPGAVGAAVEFMAEHPDVLVAYPDWNCIDRDSRVVRHVRVPDHDYARMIREHKCYIGPGAFIRRCGFDRAGLRNPKYRYSGDFEFWVRLGLYGQFARIPRTLATWRTHAGSVSSTAQGKAMATDHVRIMKEYYSRNDIPPEIRVLRRRAMASAHFKAACSSGTSKGTLLWHVVCSVVMDPRVTLGRRFRRTLSLLTKLLPSPIQRKIRQVRRLTRRPS